MGAVKAHSKRVRLHNRREINGHKDGIFVVIVFVPRWLIPIGIKPLTYGGHRSRKLSSAYPNRDAAHDPSPGRFADVNILSLQIRDKQKTKAVNHNYN
jgi:hypothetical protein